jgi:hypothetical protein
MPNRPMRPRMRPEADESTTKALTGELIRPRMRPRDKAEEFEAKVAQSSAATALLSARPRCLQRAAKSAAAAAHRCPAKASGEISDGHDYHQPAPRRRHSRR